jgi:hypothetical protein
MSQLDRLLEALDGPPGVQAKAHKELLERLDLPKVVARLARLCSEGHSGLRVAAAEVLQDLGPVAAPAFPELLEMLRDPLPEVRRTACMTLAALGEGVDPRELVDALMSGAHDPVYAVRKAATAGLHRSAQILRGQTPQPEAAADPASVRPNGLGATPQWVRGIATQLGARITPRTEGHMLTVPVGEGRHQRVRLTVDPVRALLGISTECGPLAPERSSWALQENLELHPGRLALRSEVKPGRHDELVLLANVPLDGALPGPTAALVRRIAEQGDAYECLLTGGRDLR